MAKPATIGPNRDSGMLLARAVSKSKRTSGIQLPVGFVRRPSYGEDPPPLAQMVRGGRGGEVRLKLYLTMTMVATAAPYKLDPIPGRVWATMIGLPEPETLGARRISDAIQWLEERDLIKVRRRPGSPPGVTLRSPLGDGKRYRRPTGVWVTLPLGYWKQQWITALTGSATALLIILLDLQGGKSGPADAPYVSGMQRDRYGLSADTWTRATAELKRSRILEVNRAPQGDVFDWRRMRNTYWVDKARLDDMPT